ncbi:MAG: thiamine pyrophosphate-binding protein [Bacteroidales bacterium]|nr:thiamine pyrophosphate-binding protein [Bacteroidales bacterium]
MISVSTVISDFFESKGVKHVFLLSGGMMMHLIDSLSKSEKIKYVCNHHEQACAIASESYARIKTDIGVCYATSGPGATNTITGITGAWLDSVPVIFITGQSKVALTTKGTGMTDLRMLGNFEVNITEIVKPITKYTAFIGKAEEILYQLEKAYFKATNGRPGPVLLDIPLDIQGSMVNKNDLGHFTIPSEKTYSDSDKIEKLKQLFKESNNPVILGGHGIRVSGQVTRFRHLVHKLNIPVVTTQLANDLMPYNDDLYIGRVGLRGDRAGNFAIQSADLIITLGSSLHITTTGYELEHFAPHAKIVVVDIDLNTLKKNEQVSNLSINCDVKTFLDYFETLIPSKIHLKESWISKLQNWKNRFSVITEPHERNGDEINTYHMIDVLSYQMKDDDILITDAGSLYYIVGQAFRPKKNQRVIVSGALGAMGYALPAAVGACFAKPENNVICLTGDGSMQLNVQELQTISTYRLNCKIIVLNNNGYASIRNTQVSFLNGHIAASSEETGVKFPNWEKLADAYSIPYKKENRYSNLHVLFKDLLAYNGPIFCEIILPDKVNMLPAVTSERLLNGDFKSNKLHEMSPPLSIDVLESSGISI